MLLEFWIRFECRFIAVHYFLWCGWWVNRYEHSLSLDSLSGAILIILQEDCLEVISQMIRLVMASAFAAIPNTTIVIVGPLPIACVSVVAVIHQKPTVGFISRWTVFKYMYVFFFRNFLENVPCSQEFRTRQVLYSLGTCQFLS